jgi:hypothetical protein
VPLFAASLERAGLDQGSPVGARDLPIGVAGGRATGYSARPWTDPSPCFGRSVIHVRHRLTARDLVSSRMGRRRDRGWAEYGGAPLRRFGPWRHRHRGVFQMFELNVVGWSALLGAGLLPSLLLWALGVPRLTALALGEAGTFSVVKVRDHLRWRASPIHMHVRRWPARGRPCGCRRNARDRADRRIRGAAPRQPLRGVSLAAGREVPTSRQRECPEGARAARVVAALLSGLPT